MKKILFPVFLLTIVLLSSCLGSGSAVRPMSANDVFTNGNAYIYGKFLNNGGNASINLYIENKSNQDKIGLGFYDDSNSYYMISVKPGQYHFSSAEFEGPGQSITRKIPEDLYLSRTAELTAGKAYYLGDWNAYNFYMVSGTLGVGRTRIESVDDLYKETTEVLKKKHVFLGSVETVNLVQNLKSTNAGYHSLPVAKEGENNYLNIVSMKREQKTGALLVIKIDNSVYWGGIFGDAFRNVVITIINKTTGAVLNPATRDGTFLYFPNVDPGTYRITGLNDPIGGANSMNFFFTDEKIQNPSNMIVNFKMDIFADAVYFRGVTSDIVVGKPGVYYLGGYTVSNISRGLDSMTMIRREAPKPDDVASVKAYLSNRHLDWDVNNITTTGNAFILDEFTLY